MLYKVLQWPTLNFLGYSLNSQLTENSPHYTEKLVNAVQGNTVYKQSWVMTPQIHGFVNTYYNFNGTISIPAFLDS
jgi:predicted metalloendopeptidase